ncbi:MAG: helix-hairpin-helix domain-containing protein [Acidithiobacillus sp.]|nr:helix-hairpin-helix domain-containing protein [Acidithiobacillus sp.]
MRSHFVFLILSLCFLGSAEAREKLDCPEQININTADFDGFRCLKGVGKKRAEALLQYRAEHGPFVSPMGVAAVLGEKLALRLRYRLQVGN